MKSLVNAFIIGTCVLLIIGAGADAVAKEPIGTAATISSEPPATAKATGPFGQIKLDSTTVELGDIKPGSVNNVNFTFSNVGQGNLKITEIQKTCGCTVPELAKRDYAPGESGTIKIEYSASKSAGSVVKHLFVMSDDPNNSKVEIAIKANIVLKVAVEPETMQLSLEGPDAGAPTISIFSKDNVPFSIKSVESIDNVITAQIDPNAKSTRFMIKPIVNKEKLKNNLNGLVKFNITHPDIDQVTVSYTALPEFDLQPSSLILRSAMAKQPENRVLWVKNNYNKPFQLESAVSKNGYIKVLKQEKVENMYKLTIEVTPPELQNVMYFSDTLTIKIKDGQSLDVACRGFFRRGK